MTELPRENSLLIEIVVEFDGLCGKAPVFYDTRLEKGKISIVATQLPGYFLHECGLDVEHAIAPIVTQRRMPRMDLARHDNIDFACASQMVFASVVESQNTARNYAKGIFFVTVSSELLLDVFRSK